MKPAAPFAPAIPRACYGGHLLSDQTAPIPQQGARSRVPRFQNAEFRLDSDFPTDKTRADYDEDGEPIGNLWKAEIQRDQAGRELRRNLPGGVEVQWEWDPQGRPARHSIARHEGKRTRDYRWDPGSRLRALSDSLLGETTYSHDATGNLAWSEDAAGKHLFRMPDAAGNLFRSPERTDRKYGPSGQLLEAWVPKGVIRYEYDPEGNLIRKTGPDGMAWEYCWADSGMLIGIKGPSGKEIGFQYDALGRRIRKTDTGTMRSWHWDGNTPLHEWDDEGKPLTWLFEPDTLIPLAKIEDGVGYSILPDHGGTPFGMYDSQGQETWAAQPDAYGKIQVGIGIADACPYRFQGQYEDAEAGLLYNRFRYLDPDTGCYLSKDPLQDIAGCVLARYVFESVLPPIDLLQTSSATSSYRYPADPLIWIDPFGLVRIHTEGPVEVNAYPGPPAGGKEHLPLHAHVHEGKAETRVLMEDYYKKGTLVAAKGDVYPGDPAMTKKMKKVVQGNLDSLATKTRQVFNTGSCG